MQKSSDLVRERPAVIFAAIADWADSDSFPVSFMCAELSVSRSGSYAWRTRPVCDWARNDAELTEVIIALHDELRGNPGVRRMRAELNAQGIRIGLKRVWRLMKTLGCVDAIPDSGDAPPSPASNRCRHPT